MPNPIHWTQSPPSKPKVLVVDDDIVAIKILFQLLQHECELYFVTHSHEVLPRAIELTPDLIVLDVILDEQDGYQLCEQLKIEPLLTDIPIVFITAHFDANDEARGFNCGAVDFIHKPINPQVTLARLRTHLQLKRQADLLRKLSMVDGLTGLANRRHFDQQLLQEWHRCMRQRQPLSLALIDIDWFKQYNDFYGHLAGDDCITHVARLINAQCARASDLAARYGGEEFVMLLPETDNKGATLLTQQFQQALQQLSLAHARSSFDRVTTSIGLCTVVPNDSMQPAQLLQAADELLYQAKQAGRNQLVIGSEQRVSLANAPRTEPVGNGC